MLYVVEEKSWRAMTQFADKAPNRFNVFFADTLHEGLDLLLGNASSSNQFRMHQIHVVFPTTIQTVAVFLFKK